MSEFSETSLLLIRNWDAVQGIIEAKGRLDQEVKPLLLSTKNEIVAEDWWQDGWEFIPYQDSQVFISNRAWRRKDNYAVWIGVQNFAANNIFGNESPPMLYVWVTGRRYDLAQALAAALRARESVFPGEIDNRANAYVVVHYIKKCLPGEEVEYPSMVCQQIVEFFAFYASALRDYDGIINPFLSSG